MNFLATLYTDIAELVHDVNKHKDLDPDFDVKITKLVHEYGAAHKKLFYTNKFGNKLSVDVDW